MISLLAPVVVVCQLLPVSRSGGGIPDNPYSFRVGSGGTVETVDENGKRTSTARNRRQVVLPVEDATIQTLYLASCESTRVYVYELGNEEDGWSVAVGADRGGRVRYRTALGGFNLARPAVEGGYAYLATTGCIGKLDLMTGRMLWSHRDLYQRDHAFNVFDEPVVGQTDVVFRARATPGGVLKTIVVDKVSGEIKDPAGAH